MVEFVLVHGGLHGSWCFELLERELRGMGHWTLVVDMPIDEPGKSVEDYADVVSTEDAMLDCARYRALFQGRIGVTPAELPGSHSPFLSQPAALARLMHELTDASGRA